MVLSRDDKIKYTPSADSGRWTGARGNSLCAPSSAQSRTLLAEKGLEGIRYTDGEPDFSPFSESTVQLGYMTAERHSRGLPNGRDGKNTTYVTFHEDGTTERSHKADPSSMADLHMKYDTPGNFEQADILTAREWTVQGRNGREWTAQDVADYREAHALTWHERGDGSTMDMIPRAVNDDFKHAGGVAEMKERNRMIAETAEEYPEYDSPGFDWDAASEEEYKAHRQHMEQEWYSYSDGSADSSGTDSASAVLNKDADSYQTARPSNDPVSIPPDETRTPDEGESMDALAPLPAGIEGWPEPGFEEDNAEASTAAWLPQPDAPPSATDSEVQYTAASPSEEDDEVMSMDALASSIPDETYDAHPQAEQEEQENDMAALADKNTAQEQADHFSSNTPEQESEHGHDIYT